MTFAIKIHGRFRSRFEQVSSAIVSRVVCGSAVERRNGVSGGGGVGGYGDYGDTRAHGGHLGGRRRARAPRQALQAGMGRSAGARLAFRHALRSHPVWMAFPFRLPRLLRAWIVDIGRSWSFTSSYLSVLLLECARILLPHLPTCQFFL